MAGAYRWMHAARINGIELDTWVAIFLPLVALGAAAIATTESSIVAWLVAGVGGAAWFALMFCRLRHGVMFRVTPEIALIDDDRSDTPVESPEFLASGRFVLWQGDRTRFQRILDGLMLGTRGDRWFLEVPAIFVVHDRDHFAVTAFLDPSLRFLGLKLEDKAGRWTIDGTFESLEAPEPGELHLGSRSRPAIRLRCENRQRRVRYATLSFADARQRQDFARCLRAALDAHVVAKRS